MSDGTRSRTGCLTCRIRRKKCDEERPLCQACQSRQLTCYGYDTPLPSWYTNKANWQEVNRSREAKDLRALAESRYKIRRKIGVSKDVEEPNTTPAEEAGKDDNDKQNGLQLRPRPTTKTAVPSRRATVTPNTWQLYPESIWWDSAMSNLAPDLTTSTRHDTRLLLLFLNVIHPISHGFYQLSSNADRSWLLNRLIGNQASYAAALSVSACFDHSLTQQPRINEIGICPKVRSLQNRAIEEVQIKIHALDSEHYTSLQDFVYFGVQLLDAVLSLINLEIFSMLQGYWEMHHEAARKLLSHFDTCSLPVAGPWTSPIDFALSTLSKEDERYRSLEFCVTNFVWIDVIATSIFGIISHEASGFDYIPLLITEKIKPQAVMGCQGWIMATVVEIARLEQWKVMQYDQTLNDSAEMMHRFEQLAHRLKSGIEELEKAKEPSTNSSVDLEADSRLVSILWAYGAQILLSVMIFGMHQSQLLAVQEYVDVCIRKLEELPCRLTIRANWPYTIAGCMAMNEYHERFRRIVASTMEQSQPPGMSWKGLMVMEECWRLRQNGHLDVAWREAMNSLGARILLV